MSIFSREKWRALSIFILIVTLGSLLTAMLFSENTQEENAAAPTSETEEFSDTQIAYRPLSGTPYWQQYGSDVGHRARSGLRGPQNARLRWSFYIGDTPAESIAISADDKVALSASPDYAEGYLYWLDLDDAYVNWSYRFNGVVTFPSLADDSEVAYSVADGYLHAINSSNSRDWLYYMGTGGNFTGPTVGDDGTIYAGFEDKLFAIDSSGGLNWSYQLPYYSFHLMDTPVVTSDGLVYFSTNQNAIYALTPSGGYRWSYNTGGGRIDNAIVLSNDEGSLYFGCSDYTLRALNSDGTLDWTYGVLYSGNVIGSVAVDSDGAIIFGASDGGYDNKLFVMRSDGTLRWSMYLSDPIYSSPAIDVDGSIYFDYNYGELCAVNSFGIFKWSYQTGDNIAARPSIGPYETVVFGSSDNAVYCIDSLPRLSDGRVTPSVGDTSGTYKFTVHYYSPAGRAPDRIRLQTDVSIYTMTLESGTAYDGIYYRNLTGLSEGVGDYRFYARDLSTASYVVLPPSGYFSGPTVDNTGDSHEEDDTCSQAQANKRDISTDGTPQYHTLTPGDVDWVQFTAKKYITYHVRTKLASPDCQTNLYIYDGDCSTELAFDGGSGLGGGSAIGWMCQDNGTYFIVVEHGGGGTGAGEYYLSVEESHWPTFKCDLTRQSVSSALGCPGDSLDWWTAGFAEDRTPVVDMAGRVYCETSAGWLYCLNSAGVAQWSYDANLADFTNVSLGRSGNVYFRSQSNKIVSLTSSGGLRWTYGVDNDDGGIVSLSEDEDVYFGVGWALFALQSNGSLAWTFSSKSEIAAPPAIGLNGSIYFGNTNGFLVALESDGSFIWYKDLVDSISTTPLVTRNGDVVALTSAGTLYSFNPEGGLNWSYQCDGGAVTASPVLSIDDSILVRKGSNKLFSIASDGSLDWTLYTLMDTPGTPAVDRDGYIYVGREGIKCLNPNGTTRWTHVVSGYNSDSSPAIGPDGSIYVEVGDRLYKFREVDVNLSGGTVAPTSGSGKTNFQFDVHYEGTSEPGLIYVYIDGNPHDMDLESGNANDGLYRYETDSLSEGSHKFFFYAESTTGRWDLDPASGTYDGPDVDDTDPVSQAYSPAYRSTGNIPVDFDASDNATGIDTVFIYYAYEGGGWVEFDTSTNSSGTVWCSPVHGDGEYAFCTRAVDGAGNTEEYPSDPDSTTIYDTAPPTSSCDSPPFEDTSPFGVDFSASDAASGIAEVSLWYRKDGGTWTLFHAITGKATGAFDFTTSGEGEYEFYTRAEDLAGNGEDPPPSPDDSTIYDITNPSSECTAPQFASSSPFGVDFTASDALSGIRGVGLWFNKEGSGWTYFGSIADETQGTFEFTPSGDGQYEFYTRAQDQADNLEDPPGSADSSTDFDTISPSSECSSAALESGSPFPVDFTASDAYSGIAEVSLWFNKDGGGWTNYDTIPDKTEGTFQFTPSGDGEYEFYTRAMDKAGNVEDPPGAPDSTTTYDSSKPTSSCDSPQYENTPPIKVNYQTNGGAGSSILKVELYSRFDGGSYTLYDDSTDATGSFDFDPASGNGAYAFYTIAYDEAGNSEDPPGTPDSETVFDDVLPSSTCDSPEYVTEGTIAVSYTSSDTLSGIAQIALYWMTEDTGWTEFEVVADRDNGTVCFDPPADDKYFFTSVATDRAGNQEGFDSTKHCQTVYDTEKPFSDCDAPEYASGETIEVAYSAEDAECGLKELQLWYRHNSGDWTFSGLATDATSGIFEFRPDDYNSSDLMDGSGDGLYDFYTLAYDYAGWGEDPPSTPKASTMYDTIKPTSECYSPDYSMYASIDVGYTASDETSGIALVELYYSKSGSGAAPVLWGGSTTGTVGVFNFVAPAPGRWELFTIAYDLADNKEDAPGAPDTETLLDDTGPTSKADCDPYSNVSPISVSFQAQDDSSGIERVELYRKDGPGWVYVDEVYGETSGSFDVAIGMDGLYEFATIAHDSAGNAEGFPGQPDCGCTFDTESPTSDCTSPQYSKTATFGVEFEAEDTLSGVAQVSLYLRDGGNWLFLETKNSTSGTFEVTASTEGLYEFATVAEDNAGNTEEFPPTPDCSCLYDATLPTSECDSPLFTTDPKIDVAFAAGDAGSGIARVELYRKGPSAWVLLDGIDDATEGTFEFTFGGETKVEFATLAFDAAGNEEEFPTVPDCSCTYDISSPSSICFAPEYSSEATFAVRYAAIDGGGSGVAGVSLYYASDMDSSWQLYGFSTEGTIGTFVFEMPFKNEDEVQYYFYTRALDRTGNTENPPNAPDNTTIWDVAPPVTTCSSPEYSNSSPVPVEFTIDEGLAGLRWARLAYKYGSQDWAFASAVTKATVGVFPFRAEDGDGPYEFCIAAMDNCDNLSYPNAPRCSTLFDTVKPTSSCTSIAFTTVSTIDLDYDASDDRSGISSVVFLVKYANGSWRDTGLSSGTPSGQVTFIPADGDGVYNFISRATDKAGNQEAIPGEPDCVVVVDRSTPQLTIGRVNPQSGTPDDDFTFLVNFEDADGAAPSESNVYIDGTAYAMSLSSGAPADGTYSYVTKLVGGTHSFYFHFTDAYGLDSRLPASDSFTGPDVNSAPEMSDGKVLPALGDTESVFDFSAAYHDEDGDEPALIQVVIDGTSHDMTAATPGTKVPYHKDYTYSKKLAEGEHEFFFRCQDTNGASARLPVAGQFDGPTVMTYDDDAPYCRDMVPAPGATDVPPDTTISLKLVDDTSNVDTSSIVVTVAGVRVAPTINSTPDGYRLTIEPAKPFPEKMVVPVTVIACDTSIRRNCMEKYTYRFTVRDTTAPIIIRGSMSVTPGQDVAAIEWLTNEAADSRFEYSEAGGLVLSTTSSIMQCFHSMVVRDLSPATTYYFRVGSTDEAGNGPTYSNLGSFTTDPEADDSAPMIVIGPAASVFETSVTLIWATDEPSTGAAEISMVPARSGDKATRSVKTDTEYTRAHALFLEGLSSNTTYQARVTSADMSGNVVRSNWFEFTTHENPDTRPPEILEGPRVVYISDSEAIVGCVVDELSYSWVEFGMSDDYGRVAKDGRAARVHTVFLTSLDPATEYHYRMSFMDLMDNGPTSSADLTFRTLAEPDTSGLYCVSGPDLDYVTDRLAKIVWETNHVSDTRVAYWETGQGPADGKVWKNTQFRRTHQAFLGNLAPGTEYTYAISSTDPSGNSLSSPKMGSFTTLVTPDSSAPGISGIGISYNAAGKVRIDWQTTEPADSRIEFWQEGLKQTGKGSWAGSENKKEHSGWIGDLELGTDYQFSVGSSDPSGNGSWSAQGSFSANADDDVINPSFTSGPDIDSRRGPVQVAVSWTTSEIADTHLVYWLDGEEDGERFTYESYEHSIAHRVELSNLEPGAYDFEASSKDPAGNSTETRGGTFTVSGSADAPRLTNGYVDPAFGTPMTEFTYRVTYSHAAGGAPQQAKVIIDGSNTNDMLLVDGDANNGSYVFATNLSAGSHTFSFEFRSSSGGSVKYPDSGSYDGPVVTATRSITLSIRTDESEYKPGDTQRVLVDATNWGEATDVDLYACVLRPEGDLLFWPAMTGYPAPCQLRPFPGESTFKDFLLHEFALPLDWSRGDYRWFIALTKPGTYETECKLATARFSVAQPDLDLSLTVNAPAFVPGDEMVVSLSLENPGDYVDIDLFMYATLPDGTDLYMPALTTDAAPMVSIGIPDGFSYYGYEALRLNLMEGLPNGTYRWSAYICKRGTSDRISQTASASFEIFNVDLALHTNGAEFGPGDDLEVTADVRNYGEDIDIDLYSWMVTPDGVFFCLPYLNFAVNPAIEFKPLSRGASYESISIFSATLPPGLTEGEYTVQAALIIPGNESYSGKMAEARFSYSNQ
ncbi:MAG: PQQ-binding-like beta-propeller repeat protein [Candidatus Coatesbacteria bacterium]|nr:PQQ-binding-like beta-propeller repeat protein [Candidatus Coatesbacteria bacterium]